MGKKNRIAGFLISGITVLALFLSACGGEPKAADVGIPAGTEVTVYQSRF